MTSPLSRAPSQRRRLSALLGLAIAAATLCGCRDFGNVTASMAGAGSAMPNDDPSLRAYADHWGKVYDEAPGEKIASMNYARALRALTRYDEAASVMRTAAVRAPKDYEVLGAYGKSLADSGQLEQARDVLTRAYPPTGRTGPLCRCKVRLPID